MPSRKPDATIVDVARTAGVSAATVSRVLNGSGPVSPSARGRVEEAVRRLRYMPNASAKSLRHLKTSTLAVIVSDILVSYYAEIIKGIENTAGALRYKILICDAQNQREKEADYMTLAMDRTVDGIILIAPMLGDAELAAYADRGYALGVIGRRIDHPAIPCVYTDNVGAATEAVTHLIAQGHERIAFLSGFADATDSYERLEGYMKALRQASLPFRPELIDSGGFSEPGGYEAFLRLRERSSAFTAVFAANDEMALGIYRACAELGIPIPAGMAVVGVDNNRVGRHVDPALSTVDPPKHAMGALLAEKLIDQLGEGRCPGTRCFEVGSRLLVRGSSIFNNK
ncbi:LacI family DNA-binding transcriptional regulator [Paenibacillus pasadenensis]|uniref:LacI family DNA-binding transcriptional regulator n=1 Tax=Paenibacillus TaxID=44249 RepID=UPI001E6507C2|nr:MULTISPECIES: LacI family DNA-binding transcriptional regulator [Paenibacillus]